MQTPDTNSEPTPPANPHEPEVTAVKTHAASLKLLQGGGGALPADVDWVALLEEMDVRDALPILQRMGRQRKPAANQVLALVEPPTESTMPAPTKPR